METGFSFSEALVRLKNGKMVCRLNWNGKGMYVFLIDNWNAVLKANLIKIDFKLLPWIAMKTSNNGFVPWLASQTDILADDWMEVL